MIGSQILHNKEKKLGAFNKISLQGIQTAMSDDIASIQSLSVQHLRCLQKMSTMSQVMQQVWAGPYEAQPLNNNATKRPLS